ncbi:MAG: adenylate/guanylate cyclase domain-containing protein [Alphaproteobacteria bacterium]|nr:adenylate/guanylate cyclase domain-containing protein [Alphaproteobacteria bacterium]
MDRSLRRLHPHRPRPHGAGYARCLPASSRCSTADAARYLCGVQHRKRILSGEILRGSGESINAALLLSDFREFTLLSDSLPRDHLIALLNAFFERISAAVECHGGEVLKFMGDAVLEIFAAPEGVAPAGLCDVALAATREAMVEIEGLNRARTQSGEQPLRYGFALHVGEVMYRNIGAPNRLDFTVIGSAINLASRLKGLAGEPNLSIVMSSAFARQLPDGAGASHWPLRTSPHQGTAGRLHRTRYQHGSRDGRSLARPGDVGCRHERSCGDFEPAGSR